MQCHDAVTWRLLLENKYWRAGVEQKSWWWSQRRRANDQAQAALIIAELRRADRCGSLHSGRSAAAPAVRCRRLQALHQAVPVGAPALVSERRMMAQMVALSRSSQAAIAAPHS
jgi:hypothetical protein